MNIITIAVGVIFWLIVFTYFFGMWGAIIWMLLCSVAIDNSYDTNDYTHEGDGM